MPDVFNIFYSVILASWNVLLDSAPFVLLGFFMSGLLKAFLPDDFVSRHLSGRGVGSILKGALLGVPIPLCSCGVLPAAAGLKKQGAGKGAVTSFLISTPETGKDAIAVTYALLDPLMAVVRPVVALIMAIGTGIFVSFSERGINGMDHSENDAGNGHSQTCSSSCCTTHSVIEKRSIYEKFRGGMSFAFGDLLKDVAGWLFVGIMISGLISVFVSTEIVERFFSNEFLSMILMFLFSVPLYVCATSSTPIVAALALKGLSPGAALVFLLAGPATNAASLPVISRILGKKATGVYLLSIVIISIISGFLVNDLYLYLGLDIKHWVSQAIHEEGGVVPAVSSILLVSLVIKSFLPAKRSCCDTGAHSHEGSHEENNAKIHNEDHLHCECGKS
ncbi:MAG: SO_0444 family Cu/Zn efflux transporter [Chlorobiaceae bacterium]|nr:SO_0444 family Cu/Zn efflux transporter [Chlorobiaceae bacterium]